MKTKTYMLYEWEMHGSGMFRLDKLKELEEDIGIKFNFSSESLESIINRSFDKFLDELSKQIIESGAKVVEANDEDDVEIEVEFINNDCLTTWSGSLKNCDICKQKIVEHFIDGKTKMGPWGIMCYKCYLKLGVGLGVGLGQLYIKVYDRFVKVEMEKK